MWFIFALFKLLIEIEIEVEGVGFVAILYVFGKYGAYTCHIIAIVGLVFGLVFIGAWFLFRVVNLFRFVRSHKWLLWECASIIIYLLSYIYRK